MSTRCAAEMYTKKFGVTVAGWKVLSIVGTYEPIRLGGVASRASMDLDKISRAVDRLVTTGLVVRTADTQDRRRVVLTLTARGRRVYSEIDYVLRAVDARFLSVPTKDELRRFKLAMDKLEAQARRIFAGKGAWRAILKESRVPRN